MAANVQHPASHEAFDCFTKFPKKNSANADLLRLVFRHDMGSTSIEYGDTSKLGGVSGNSGISAVS